MAVIVSCSLNSIQASFLEDKNLSPSSLLQDKINEMMKLSPQEYQEQLKAFQSKRMTKWQERYWQAQTFEDKERLVKEFSESVGYKLD